MIKIAIMGYGTIGSGVYEVLEQNQDVIAADVGQEIQVKYILDLRDFPGTPAERKIIRDFSAIAEDEEIQIVVETMGGLDPAYTFVKTCLEAGKHVVTSNKALVAAHGTELLAIAREKQVNFQFEASVGGGIPIIRPMYRCLKGERIQEITGILNGTTNFILTKMDREGVSFNSALKEAQDRGYAERSPEADVKGCDTCRKLAILTAMATGREVNCEDIYTEGITSITDMDFKYADKLGASIKLLGFSRMEGDRVFAWVAPLMIGREHPLYFVSSVQNGILVKGNMLGTAMFYGSGAGKLPTASAVVADIMDEAKHLHFNIPLGWSSEKQEVAPMEASSHRYFVRVSGRYDAQKALVERHFGAHRALSLEGLNEYAFLTDTMNEKVFRQVLAELKADLADRYQEILQTIRAEL